MIKVEIVKDMLYLVNNEKGKYYIQCISRYDSGKTHSEIMFIYEQIYYKLYVELCNKCNVIQYDNSNS